MITRNYEVVIDGRYFALEVVIDDDQQGVLRIEIERCESDEGEEIEVVPPDVMRELERTVDLDGAEIRRDLDQAAYDAAMEAKVSERKEGGN